MYTVYSSDLDNFLNGVNEGKKKVVDGLWTSGSNAFHVPNVQSRI